MEQPGCVISWSKSIWVNQDFQTWCLIGWWLCCAVEKSLLTNIDFQPEFSLVDPGLRFCVWHIYTLLPHYTQQSTNPYQQLTSVLSITSRIIVSIHNDHRACYGLVWAACRMWLYIWNVLSQWCHIKLQSSSCSLIKMSYMISWFSQLTSLVYLPHSNKPHDFK